MYYHTLKHIYKKTILHTKYIPVLSNCYPQTNTTDFNSNFSLLLYCNCCQILPLFHIDHYVWPFFRSILIVTRVQHPTQYVPSIKPPFLHSLNVLETPKIHKIHNIHKNTQKYPKIPKIYPKNTLESSEIPKKFPKILGKYPKKKHCPLLTVRKEFAIFVLYSLVNILKIDRWYFSHWL